MGNYGFMCKYFKKAWNDPVISQLIVFGIITGLGYLVTWLSKISLESIWANYSQIIITFIAFWIIIFIYRIRSKKPSFLKETKTHEKICGYHWIWQWEYIPDKGKYEINNLYPVCPKCGNGMMLTQDCLSYVCPNNHTEPNNPDVWFSVDETIRQTIKNKYPKYSDKII